MKARAEASSGLRTHLAELQDRYPNAHHAIIAHSHGGNTALTALADPDLAAGMVGVVALATPFLSARSCSREPLLSVGDSVVAAVCSGAAVFLAGAALGHGGAWGIQALLTFGGVTGLLGLGYWVYRIMTSHASRVCESMAATRLRSTQLAIVRTSADEAMAAITGARVAGACVAMFWDAVSGRAVRALRGVLNAIDYLGTRARARAWLENYYKVNGSLRGQDILAKMAERSQTWKPAKTLLATLKESLLVLLPGIIANLDLVAEWPAARWFVGGVAIAYGVPAIGALLLTVSALPFGIMSALGLLPCGWTLPLAGPYLRVSAEPVPPGTWTVTQVITENGNGRLSHGRTHDDPAVHAFVGRWLSERAELAARHTWPMPPPPCVPGGR